MPKRLALRLINLVWYSTALLIVLTAMIVAIGRELLPQVSLQHERLLALLSERTGTTIHATDLHLQWSRLYPELNAQSLDISTTSATVHIERIRMELDILQSLLLRTPVVDHLYVSEASVQLAPLSDTASTPPDIEKTWQFLNRLLQKDIEIQKLHITREQGDTQKELHLADLRLEQHFGRKKIFLRLLDPDGDETLHAVGQLEGDTLHSSRGRLYAKADQLSLQTWIGKRNISWLDLPWQASGEAWFDWEGMRKINVTGNTFIDRNSTTTEITLPDTLHAAFSAKWHDGDTQLDIHTLGTRLGDQEQPWLDNARISYNTSRPAQWRLQIPALPLERLLPLQHYLPDGKLRELLLALHPSGRLENIDLQWDNSKPLTERMNLRANANALETGAWHGVPAFTGVSGYLQSGIGYGHIDLDSRNGFSMFYPEIYRAPLMFQTAAGRVQWHWQPEHKTVLVGSDYAALDGDMGQARGNFWLHLPLPGADFSSEMFLAIGLRGSEAKYRNNLLPYTLPPGLLEWLGARVGDGKVPTAGFFYRGALSGRESNSRTVQFVADVRNGDVEFDPAWPRLTGVNANLLVDDGNTIVRASSGMLYNTAIENTRVTVTALPTGLMLGIRGAARGYAEDGLRLLRETPLKNVFGNSMDSWRIPRGLLTTSLSLQLPINGATGVAQEDVRVELFDTQLIMDDLKLSFDNTQGDLRYQTAHGLSANRITASLFSKPITVDIKSRRERNELAIQVNGAGQADAATLAKWSNLQPLLLAKGPIDYKAKLALGPFGTRTPPSKVAQLELQSELKQTVLPLPPPYGKQAGERKPFTLSVDLHRDNRQDYRFTLDNRINGAMTLRKGQWHSGEIVVEGNASLPDNPSPLHMRGNIAATDVQPWLDLIAAYKKLPSGTTGSSATSYPTFAFKIGNATWKDLSFPDLQLVANHENNRWQLYFDSASARGSAFFHDDNRPPDINLSQLTYNPVSGHDNSAAMASINFADVPSMNIRIDHLIMNGMDVGHLSTALRSKPDALHFQNLQADGPGYQLRDATGINGASLLWSRRPNGGEQTEAHGLLQMQGEQPALAHLGIDPFVRGEKIRLYGDFTWPGPPTAAGLPKLQGALYTDGKNGKYLQANPNAAMRALGFINVATWARRLRLDFSDLTSDGISFDEYKGRLQFDSGVMTFTEPLKIKSPSSELAMDGKAMLKDETLDLRLNATLPVGNNATWIAAIAGGLPAAAGVYLVSKVFDNQIQTLTSLSYRITGPMREPDVSFERIAPPKTTAPPKNENLAKPAKASAG